ncbi:NAD-dependent epimerase/dehydratase family protein [Flavobacterium taihuense]|uniref:NAD-dependent epimerase/dehydratase family protein n=1 Tax=Flavobacterium taihuense TaxID=2857508 RepID=A0ABS6XX07_9FLAO|nr:NAD-dependent epimerase/dehydratase family protein [Flavobacterium taihuense]MBW4361182.1 NAD-dependent epimerase/dehydratase family protein [Flavobacterium taihuense]
MRQISILGCGWLGLPLAKALLTNGFSVKGSTTTEDKLPVLKAYGIDPFLIALDSKSSTPTIEVFLNESKTLVINIPPQLRRKKHDSSTVNEKVFVEKIKTLIPYIEKSTIENVLFVSSTSVYGETNATITEETIAKPDTESGKQLLEGESLLRDNPHFKTTILRFGGLIGEDRNPTKSMAGKTNLENPETPINFIHQEDCIGIILKILLTNSWDEIYNGVSPFHPTRETYYTQKATELGLPLPQFDHCEPSAKKLILSSKIENVLGYSFIKTNL